MIMMTKTMLVSVTKNQVREVSDNGIWRTLYLWEDDCNVEDKNYFPFVSL